ncbi:MAG TPA: DUF2934 domain-containing protein [Terriglobales bacterium]|nr:DUF2934 domain-containing protein [Terriglobales bacterium]
MPDSAGRVMYIDEQSNREEVVRQLAYQFYELRGREEGHALDDWLAAEKSVQTQERRAQAA